MLIKNKFDKNSVKILQQKVLYQGFFKLEQATFTHQLFQGGWSRPIVREILERGEAVMVLPFDKVLDKVVLVEQLRFPAINSSASPWLLECPAGMIEPHLSKEENVLKELKEETGLEAQSLHYINSFLTTPGGSSERVYFYIALVDSATINEFSGVASEGEDIRVHALPRAAAFDAIEAGEIDNAFTVLALQHLQLTLQKWRNDVS